ncbi:MAG TPA: NAD-dependent epimerase/dehydratase family protein [Verrucomicrobiae bacterium]
MKVLVTGGAGFIGSHIVESFQGSADVRVLDNLRSGFLRNLWRQPGYPQSGNPAAGTQKPLRRHQARW